MEFEKFDLFPEKSMRLNVQEWVQQNFRAPLKNFCPKFAPYSANMEANIFTSPDEVTAFR